MAATMPAPVPAPARVAPVARVAAIDVIRGAVMVLMALDHVRVFSGLPAGGPTPGIFFTRWVTHFCAPAFIFLAGTSAYFHGQRRPGLPRFLVTRGAWLILLELTIVRLAWTFNVDFAHYEMAGVIWVIGWCMILLGRPAETAGPRGRRDRCDHHGRSQPARSDAIVPAVNGSSYSGLWKILYVGFYAGPIPFGADGPKLIVLYSIIPWIGVMAAGYAFGTVLRLEPARRVGCASPSAWVPSPLPGASRIQSLRRSTPWDAPSGPDPPPMPALLAFLNTTKYPASLSFLLMTLGPTIALIPVLEDVRGAVARWLTVFGRVPFFFYLLHIPLIHAIALVVSTVRLGEVSPWLFTNHPMGNPPPPPGYTWSLGPALRHLGGGGRRAVRPVPLVRGGQGQSEGVVAGLSLTD